MSAPKKKTQKFVTIALDEQSAAALSELKKSDINLSKFLRKALTAYLESKATNENK